MHSLNDLHPNLRAFGRQRYLPSARERDPSLTILYIVIFGLFNQFIKFFSILQNRFPAFYHKPDLAKYMMPLQFSKS